MFGANIYTVQVYQIHEQQIENMKKSYSSQEQKGFIHNFLPIFEKIITFDSSVSDFMTLGFEAVRRQKVLPNDKAFYDFLPIHIVGSAAEGVTLSRNFCADHFEMS